MPPCTEGGLDTAFTRDRHVMLHEEIVYRLTVRELRSLAISGVMEVEASGLSADVLDVAVSGVSTARLSGTAARQNLAASGTARYLAETLQCVFQPS